MAFAPGMLDDLGDVKSASRASSQPQEELALKVAKTLQSSFSKQVDGVPRKWRDVDPEARKMWLRLSRTAMKIVLADHATMPSAIAVPDANQQAPGKEPTPLPKAVSHKEQIASPPASEPRPSKAPEPPARPQPARPRSGTASRSATRCVKVEQKAHRPLGCGRSTVWLDRSTKLGLPPEQAIGMLRGDRGMAEPKARRSARSVVGLGISEQSYYRWRRLYGGLKVDQAKRLKDLERENQRLKKAASELTLDNLILKEALEGKYSLEQLSWPSLPDTQSAYVGRYLVSPLWLT